MKFNPAELDDIKVTLPTKENPRGFTISYNKAPITARENYRRALQGKAEWLPSYLDVGWFCPEIIPDNPARAFVIEGTPYKGPVGGMDMFNIYWEYEPKSHGSIVRPGNPTLKDVSKWREVIQFPDIETWDWAGSAAKTADYLKAAPKFQNFCFFTGYFERLISFMDCGPALYALMNRKTQPYVNEIFTALTDLWIDIVDHVVKYYAPNIDGFALHDDWGAQDAPFFSKRVVDAMLVPHMKRLTDHIHALGYKCELHSCGKLKTLITSIEEAGWDSWQGMDINDYHEAYGTLTTKLIMNTPCDENLNTDNEEEIDAIAKRYVDEYANQEHMTVIRTRAPINPRFYINVYKYSRMKFGGVE